MASDLSLFCVSPEISVRQAIAQIDRNGKGVVMVVDAQRHLLGVITDGDIRRAILAALDLGLSVSQLLAQRVTTPSSPPRPVTAQAGTSVLELLNTMNRLTLRHLPLTDKQGRVVDIALLGDLVKDYEMPLQAFVMAGGAGTRLRPLTEDMPKPMLPVGDRPLLELTIAQLREAGIQRVNIATHYKADKITEHFGDGRNFGVELNYVTEDRPLGTAGALGLMETPEQPLLVINGDILTRVDFRIMMAYHQEHRADLTVAVRQHEFEVPYGVISCDGPSVQSLVEKPRLSFFVNAGIYLLEPSVHRYIPCGQRFDMTDLILRLLNEARNVVSFPIMEYCLDIGKHADYQQAQEDVRNGRLRN